MYVNYLKYVYTIYENYRDVVFLDKNYIEIFIENRNLIIISQNEFLD